MGVEKPFSAFELGSKANSFFHAQTRYEFICRQVPNQLIQFHQQINSVEQRAAERHAWKIAPALTCFGDDVDTEFGNVLVCMKGARGLATPNPLEQGKGFRSLNFLGRGGKPREPVGGQLRKLYDFLTTKLTCGAEHRTEHFGGFLDLLLNGQHFKNVFALYLLAGLQIFH